MHFMDTSYPKKVLQRVDSTGRNSWEVTSKRLFLCCKNGSFKIQIDLQHLLASAITHPLPQGSPLENLVWRTWAHPPPRFSIGELGLENMPPPPHNTIEHTPANLPSTVKPQSIYNYIGQLHPITAGETAPPPTVYGSMRQVFDCVCKTGDKLQVRQLP